MSQPVSATEFDIAIIGMSCRFPGARNVEEFWRNLANGVESIARLSDEEMLNAGVPRSFLEDPSYVKAAPVLEDPGFFDAAFFGFSPSEAKTMDPQHRILLELAHEALEDAGCYPDRHPGRVGVFTGAAMNTYFMGTGLSDRFATDYIPTLIGNDKDFLSTRLSYKLNLKGPSITIQTACSTSLVAIHLARQSLLAQETDVALAGAISVRVPHQAGYFCDGGGVLSPDGHVRAFDAKANGTVFGSGGGIIVLKRLADALADGDTIHAIIKGSAVNNDGSEKAGYTAPSVNSQADAVIEALTVADLDADNITYMEAHGSGTPVGDPIEVAALTKAFRSFTQRSVYCAIGSVKTNVGHLDAAAGIAGVIKTVLAMKHGKLPPSLNYDSSNPEINFPGTPFYVNTQLAAWTATAPRRAGVMSTGIGGTNAHLVLEEAPMSEELAASGLPHLLVLSAKSPNALDVTTARLVEFLRGNADVKLENIAYTLQVGREAFPYRKMLVCHNRDDGIRELGQQDAKRVIFSRVDESIRRPVVFLLPGIGDHYVGMARELYHNCEIFRNEVDNCATIIGRYLDADIRDIIYPEGVDRKTSTKPKGIDLKKMLGEKPDEPAARKLNETIYAQPALFTIEYALARLWESLGVTPDVIVGHSMGEYVAACLSGVCSLEDAVRLVVGRAQLVSELPEGAMLAVLLSEAELTPLLNDQLSISLINGPNLCVVAGPVEAIADFERALSEKSIISRRVQNGHAFHSNMLDPIVPALTDKAKQAELREPKIPYISNVTGKWITNSEATDPAYWARHASHAARFSDGLQELWQLRDPILLEIGPGKTLGLLAAQHPGCKDAGEVTVLSSLRHDYENESDVEFLWSNIGRLWLSGVDINWENLSPGNKRRKISLPTYPFERENYWMETSIHVSEPTQAKERSIHKNVDFFKWFYVPSWKRTLPKASDLSELCKAKRTDWLIFSNDEDFSSQIVCRLKACPQRFVIASAGSAYQQVGPDRFILRPDNSGDYELLVQTLKSNGFIPDHVIHAWNVDDTSKDRFSAGSDTFGQAQDLGFYSLLFFARAFANCHVTRDLKLLVLSRGIQEVFGNEVLIPERSTSLGPCIVIPQEHPNIRVKSVDLENDCDFDDEAIDQLFGECLSWDSELFVAHRKRKRWVQTCEQVELGAFDTPIFRQNGVYLITGGLGNVGCEISKHLAKNYKARLVLLGRARLPARESWSASIGNAAVAAKIRRLGEIEALGGEVLYLEVDVGNLDKMRLAIEQAEQRFGKLHGVIHAAGVVGDEGYQEVKDVDAVKCDLHFRAKACGLQVLERLLEGKQLDFCLLLSSLTSVLGGVGQAAYSSSNIYMDAFARKHNRLGRPHWLSVNWDVWRVGVDVWRGSGLGKTLADLGMTPGEAIRALELALSLKNTSQLIVSTGDLEARIRQWVKLESLNHTDFASGLTQTDLFNVDAATTRSLSGDTIEQTITKIWQDALGLKQLGLDDNFADLGGHSLLAIKIVAELRKAFQLDLSVKAIFDAPSVAELACYIRNQLAGNEQVQASPQGVEVGSFAKAGSLPGIIKNETISLPKEEAFVVPPWFVQQNNWVADSSNSDSAIYNYPLLVRISGKLDRVALEQALHEIMLRHEVFRSIFRIRNGELLQVVGAAKKFCVRLIDLTDLPEAERETRLDALVLDEAQRPFDFQRDLLLRAVLYQLAPTVHVFQLTTHHIVCDDWSTGILAQELASLYQSFASGATPALDHLPFRYRDYVRWHESQLEGESLEPKLFYWKEQLRSATRFEHLTPDFPRPEVSSNRGARESMVLPAELATSLAVLGRKERVSLFMVLLAGFQCLLHRYSGDDSIEIATCAANRPIAEVEGVIGRFGNDLLLRTSFAENPTFRELLSRVRQTALTAYSNQDLPFGLLWKECTNDLRRNPSGLPFQVMFILQNAPRSIPEVAGLTMSWASLFTGTAKYDLTVWLKVDPSLEVTFEYRTDLFRGDTIKALLAGYQDLLATMVEDPGARVSGLRTPQQALPATGQLVAAKEIAAPEEYAMQKADVELRLVKLWETTLRVQPIGIDQNFFEMGGDSLLAARLFAQIGKAFQMDLPLATLLEAPTIRQLAARIRSGKSRSPDSCLVAIQPKGTKPPLFCVHGHMGEIFYCWNLAHCMGPDQPLFGLRAKGLGGELPHHTVEEMAAHYLREIRAMQACGPYFLSGYCLGGMVAFEMARLLEHEGEEVALLMLFNAPAPGGLEGWPLRWSYLSKRIGHELGKLRTLRTREKLVILGHKALALASLVIGNFKAAVWGALPASITSREGRERQRWLSVADINVAAAKAYRPGAYAGRITLFSTKELASLYAIDAEAGWASLAAGGVELYTVAGDNNSMFDARFIDGLTQKLKSCIANANMSTAVHCESASQPKQRNATFPAPTTAAPTYSGSGDKC